MYLVGRWCGVPSCVIIIFPLRHTVAGESRIFHVLLLHVWSRCRPHAHNFTASARTRTLQRCCETSTTKPPESMLGQSGRPCTAKKGQMKSNETPLESVSGRYLPAGFGPGHDQLPDEMLPGKPVSSAFRHQHRKTCGSWDLSYFCCSFRCTKN